MIVLKSTYIADASQLQQHLDAHLAWVEEGYSNGNFLASGLRTGAVGAMIIVRGLSADEMQQMLSRDPFVVNAIAEYEILEFDAMRTVVGLEDAS